MPKETEGEKSVPDFYLKQLRVVGFRSIEDETFDFSPTLNVIVGANNSGKTAVIDALRIIFNLGSFQKKEDLIKLRSADIFRRGPLPDRVSISFEATFSGISSPEIVAQFLEMYANEDDPDQDEPSLFKLRYQVDFSRDPNTAELRYRASRVSGGERFENPVSSDTLDFMRSVYLAPLRDIVNDGRRLGREIERLIAAHSTAGTLASIPQEVRDKAEGLIAKATGGEHEKATGKNLSHYAGMYGIPEDSLKFVPSGLGEDMLRSLQVVYNHGLHGASGLGLDSNGLGINNLIYASVVLSREAGAGDDTRSFFLIEEPEAHLHPQAQDSFFRALNEITDHQVFITSHSPTVTAKCDLKKVIVMGHPCAYQRRAVCHLSKTLTSREGDSKYLHKFLDVTRSQILFAKGAVFVEGITEAMLIQVFSENLDMDLRSAGVEIVCLGSNGGFEHFKTLLGPDGLDMPCVFLTDGDQKPKDLPAEKNDLLARVKTPEIVKEGRIRTYRGLGTFEFELLLAAAGRQEDGMREMLTKAMADARSSEDVDTAKNFAADFMDFSNPALAYSKMKQSKVDSGYVAGSDWKGLSHTNGEFIKRKSEFAYNIFQGMATLPDGFLEVPTYIKKAIEYVVTACSVPSVPSENQVSEDGDEPDA